MEVQDRTQVGFENCVDPYLTMYMSREVSLDLIQWMWEVHTPQYMFVKEFKERLQSLNSLLQCIPGVVDGGPKPVSLRYHHQY